MTCAQTNKRKRIRANKLLTFHLLRIPPAILSLLYDAGCSWETTVHGRSLASVAYGSVLTSAWVVLHNSAWKPDQG